MSGVAIVAIPRQDDPIWQFSSEKVPHVTILHLGESGEIENLDQIIEYVEHACSSTFTRFSLDASRRGTLGDAEADVLFFEEKWDDLPELKQFRGNLLKHPSLKMAFDTNDKFPKWNPHLTVGYPETPAPKPEKGERFPTWIRFDRIAVWTDDYAGPTFDLKDRFAMNMEVSMDGTTTFEDFLAHYGVKGMKWGVRRKASVDGTVTVKGEATAGKAKVTTSGGQGAKPHPDAISARVMEQKLKKGGLNALSNDELRALNMRKQLENQSKQLTETEGRKFVKNLLRQQGSQQINRTIQDTVRKQQK